MADEITLTDDDRRLIEATCDALELEESAKTAMLSVTHAPIGKGGTNWITKSKPGNTGQLPAYIQNVRNAIMRDGTDESKATAIAIGRVRDWAEGKGNVGDEVKAASVKAIAEFDKMRAGSHVRETPAPRPRARISRPAAPADAASTTFELGILETAQNPGVTRYGHPITKTSFPGQQKAKKPAASRTRSGSGVVDPSKHPRGRGGEWVLKTGAASDLVKVVQRRVGARADGQYGAMTRQSVIDFQRKHGLAADGVVGRQTIAAMRGDANASHLKPGGATLADRRWLAGRAAMRRVREGAPAPRHAPRAAPVLEATGVLSLKLDSSLRLVEAVDLAIHEQADLALVETAAGASVAVDMSILEAAGDGWDNLFNADGSIDLVIIRPCNGRGVGNRIYEADMLARDADVFAGWSMFDNHDSPAAKRARMGLPRPPSELGGQILESWWDGSFSTPHDTQLDLGQGAVIGRCMLTGDMEQLVRRIPHAIKLSVNAEATGLRAGSRNGRKGVIVEGFVNDPENYSVDLVTKAGAGGAVARLYQDLVAA